MYMYTYIHTSVWNSISPRHDAIDLSVATASSVIIMAVHTVETAVLVLVEVQFIAVCCNVF